MASSSASSKPQHSLPLFLFQGPKKWTPEHSRKLKLILHPNLSADDLIGAQYLPDDEDEGISLVLRFHFTQRVLTFWVEFKELATKFTEPTKSDLIELETKRSRYLRNPFYLVFVRLHEAAKSINCSETSKQALTILSEILVGNIVAAKNLSVLDRSVLKYEAAYPNKAFNIGSADSF